MHAKSKKQLHSAFQFHVAIGTYYLHNFIYKSGKYNVINITNIDE